jgi:hypothetical protein
MAAASRLAWMYLEGLEWPSAVWMYLGVLELLGGVAAVGAFLSMVIKF